MATESLSGIFVVIVAMPWSVIFIQFMDTLAADSTALNIIYMAAAVLINVLIIYTLSSFVTRKK